MMKWTATNNGHLWYWTSRDAAGTGHLISLSLFHFDCESPTLKDSGVAMGVWGTDASTFCQDGARDLFKFDY